MDGIWIIVTAWALVALICVFARLRHKFVMVSVSGTSMKPTFQPGDRMIVHRRSAEDLEIGDVVVFQHPLAYDGWESLPMPRCIANGQWAVKRVAALPGDIVPDSVRISMRCPYRVPIGKIVVLADDDRGYDSRQWGFIPLERVLGSVAWKL